jgi:HSP20 family protein
MAMAAVKWAPFRAFNTLERQLHTMLDQFSGRSWLEGFNWKPDTDVFTEGDTLYVRAELPGIDPADLTVEVEGTVLRIGGEKKEEHEVEEGDRFVRECRYGSFRRDVILPEGVVPESVNARFDNGVLTVSVPLPQAIPEAPSKVAIDVEVKEPAAG